MSEPGTVRRGVPNWVRAVIALGVIVVVLVVVSNGLRNSPQETADPASSRAEVQWADYDSSVKERIDELEAAKDCAGLQAEFDTADANSAATLNRTGHGNAKLMSYIDEALRLAGCY